MTLQRYERNHFYELPIHCPLCGQQILDPDVEWGETIQTAPCPHTLFIATDSGFEYLDGRCIEALAALGFEVENDGPAGYSVCRFDVEDDGDGDALDDDDAPEPLDEDNFDELTDALDFPDGLKVASYAGPPSGAGFYVGFAPVVESPSPASF